MTIGSQLKEEPLYNPFVRCTYEQYFKDLTKEPDDFVKRFEYLRKLKDKFKPKVPL